MIEFAQEDGPLSMFNAKVGVYNGQTNILDENDNYKDVIGRVGVKCPLQDLGLAIDGGVSGYFGKVTNTDTSGLGSGGAPGGKTYEMVGTTWTATTNQKGAQIDRQYIGADLQLYYATPVVGGTCLKGEFISGTHPTKSGADDYYSTTTSVPSPSSVYKRQIMGFYAYLIQNIDAANAQLVLKYDYFDPNTKVSASDFNNTTTTLTKGDIAIGTIGFGLLYNVPWAPNMRLMLFHEIPQNEKLTNVTSGSLAAYSNVVCNELTTIRLQYKF
jgi:hypothetical protein